MNENETNEGFNYGDILNVPHEVLVQQAPNPEPVSVTIFKEGKAGQHGYKIKKSGASFEAVLPDCLQAAHKIERELEALNNG